MFTEVMATVDRVARARPVHVQRVYCNVYRLSSNYNNTTLRKLLNGNT